MVSEVTALKIENCELRRQLLMAEMQSLIEHARSESGAPLEHVYHIGSRDFKPKASG